MLYKFIDTMLWYNFNFDTVYIIVKYICFDTSVQMLRT